MDFNQDVPEIDVRADYGIERGGWVADVGGLRGGADGEELRDQVMVLLAASADDVSVNLIEISEGFTSFQE